MNKALERKLIGPLEESHTEEQSSKEVLWMELWVRRSKMAARWARTRVWAMGWFFLEEYEVDGCWNKWWGPTWDPQGRGAPKGVGHALHPRGSLVHPPGVFSVPIILKYSRKNNVEVSGHLENFYFQSIFIARIIQKTDRKYYCCFI